MKMELSVAEVLELINGIRTQPASIFGMIRTDVKESVGQYLSGLMETELTHFLGRARYQRIDAASNHRNGSYPRGFTMKGIGEVHVKVPRDRQGEFNTQVMPRFKRYEKALQEDLCLVFLSGVSARTLSLISEKLIGRRISPEEVSKASEKLVEAVEAWRQRDLSGEPIKYMYIDGTLFRMRVVKAVDKVPVLVAIGVTAPGIEPFWDCSPGIRNRPPAGGSYSRT